MKKILSLVLSFSLIITLFPAGVFAVPASATASLPVINNYAKITSQALYDSDTLVINIQDLHNNKEVQNNIYKLLESINKRYENVEVYMEGASRDIDFKKLSSLGSKNLSILMDNLFENDKLSGTEYFGYKNNKILKSVENKDVYDKNIQNYSVLIKNKKEIQKLLLKEYMKLRTLNKYLTSEQKEILNVYNAYLNKRISREKFCKVLYKQMLKRNISDWRYPNSKLYHDITKAGKKINQKKVHSQLQSVLSDLKSTLSYQNYADFLKKSDNLSDINSVFSFLSSNVDAAGKAKYPDLFTMIKLREISSVINPLDLVEEDRQKVEDILLTESTTAKNKDVVFLNLFFEVYKKLLLAEISSKEYEYYKNNYALYSDIYSEYLNNDAIDLFYFRRTAEEFNELNLERNKIFLEKMGVSSFLSSRTESEKSVVFNLPIFQSSNLPSIFSARKILIIVSGGFHSDGITKLLDENKISHITLTPNIKKNDYLYERQYLDSIVEQADADFNAISKRPWLENPQSIVRDIVSSMNEILPSLLQANQTTEQITQTVNKKIENNGANDFIKFNLDKDGNATITIDGVLYPLDYQHGDIALANGFSITTLAKNIKLLVKQILSNEVFVRQDMGLHEEGYKEKPVEQMSPTQIAEMIFMKHNILFSDFANEIMRSLFENAPNFDDRSKDRVYNMMLRQVRGEAFKDAEIMVSDSKSLIGILPDGYGNTEEYGLLFYVVWEKDEFGAEKAKNILVSNELLKYLEKFDDQALRQFFYDLFIHERLEHDALIGNDKRFNEYVFSNGLSMTSEVFHSYIRTPEFASFVNARGYRTSQIKLMDQMERIIAEVNKDNSEYSNILSLFSYEDGKAYSIKELETFLAIRTGEQDVIKKSISDLADKAYEQLEKMYIARQRNINPNYDIKKDLKIGDFIDFLNKFVVVYRKSNEYMTPDKLAEYIKDKVMGKFSVSREKASEISIQAYEFRDFPEEESSSEEDFNKAVKSKNVLVVEDIISKQSRTFNNVYKSLIDSGASGVYGLAFFDLSKEPKDNDNIISDRTFDRILTKPSVFLNSITGVNGNVKKYAAYWLTRLAAHEDKGQKIIEEQISKMDEEIVKNLLHSLFDILKNKETVKGVKSYDIVNLILYIGLGKKNITDITKEELDEFLNKYGFEINRETEPMEISFDEWKEDTPALIIFAYMSGYQFIRALGVNDIDRTRKKYGKTDRELIESMCLKYSTSFEDIKRKLKYSYEKQKIKGLDEKEIDFWKDKLEKARHTFEDRVKELAEQYNIAEDILTGSNRENYLAAIEVAETKYKVAVKEVMIEARKIALTVLEKQKIKIDEDLFLILVSGSLAKGSMMADSDVYYDIVVPDGTISKSIELRFAPLYSSILQQMGLTNYHVLKYSTTHMNKQNINTFVDEKERVPFLNYEILTESDAKEALFKKYMEFSLSESLKNLETKQYIVESLALINKRYHSVSQNGSGWLENSFFISYDDDTHQAFTTRSTLMSLETKLNELIFEYITNLGEEEDNVLILAEKFPASIKEQIDFIKAKIYPEDKNMQIYLDNVLNAWQFLASCRYVNKNNSWTPFLPGERKAIEIINGFVSENTSEEIQAETAQIEEVKNYQDMLEVVEDFVFANFMDTDVFRIGYSKYGHLEAWKQSAAEENGDMFLFAQAVSLLVDIIDIDNPESELYKSFNAINIKGFDKYKKTLIDSIKVIKFIDNNFPIYSNIDGERSIQNYWDYVAKVAGNEETMLALIAHKLTKAQITKEKEDEYLLYAVYLPLAKRFGNAEMYEYVRNDLFQYSHPGAYVNLLKIIETLYGVEYSDIIGVNATIADGIKNFLISNGIKEEDFHINFRVKSLYSIYEKLTSSRRKADDKIKNLEESDINAIRYILNLKEDFVDDIIMKAFPKEEISVESIRAEILEYVDENFDSLTEIQQRQLNKILAEMKNAIFYDYRVIDYTNKSLEDIIDDCRDVHGKLDKKLLKDTLEKKERFFELWFIELFEENLKDFIGMHVVIKDREYKNVTAVAEARDEGRVDYSVITGFVEQTKGIVFETFEKDTGNKQARLKINASVKSGMPSITSDRFALPVELCFYEKTDHEAETYGLYNLKKISAPHYIYKMGRNFVSAFFESIYSKEMDYSFLNSDEEELSYEEETGDGTVKKTESKKMIFVSDGFVPTSDLADNFDKIVSGFADSVICFVEYEGKVYIQQLPKDATVFDLATSRYFSDDTNVFVYDENGEPLSANLLLKDSKAKTYKIIKGYDKIALPSSETDVHTTRAKLIYRGEQPGKSFISKAIKKMGTSTYISQLTDVILESLEQEKLIDEKKLRPFDFAERLYREQADKDFFKNSNKSEEEFKDDVIEFFRIVSDFYNKHNLQDKNPSSIIRRSIQIAAHYNLANVLELFEAVDYGLIKFGDIENFYRTYIYIKTKSKTVTENDIFDEIAEHFAIVKVSGSGDYNLVINDARYKVEDAAKFDYDFMRQMLDIERLNLIPVQSKNDKRLSDDKESIFITIDFKMPNEPFALKSLGRNVEELVKKYAVSHPDMVRRILSMTEHIAYSGEILSQEGIGSLMDEYPVLMTQMLLGMYSEDGSAVLSEETPLLTQEENNLLITELQTGLSSNGITVSDIKIAVSRSLDLAESEDSYSFATLDVSADAATLFISEAFLRMLDKLPANEKEYFLIQLVAHEVGEFKAELDAKQKGIKFDYSQYHKRLEANSDQRNLMDKAASVAPDVVKMRTALINVIITLQDLKIDNLSGKENIDNVFWNMNIIPSDIVGALHNFAEVLAYTLNGDIVPVIRDNRGLFNFSLEDLKDILFLFSVTNSEEKAKVFAVFEELAKTNEKFRTADGVIELLEKYIDKSSPRFMLLSDIIKYLYSDTSLQRPVENIEPILPEPTADLGSLSDITSLDEQTTRIHRLLSAA